MRVWTVAGSARRDAFVGHAGSNQSTTRLDARRLPLVRLEYGFLSREILCKLVDLTVSQAPADAPHIFKAGWIAAALLSKTFELSNEIRLLLCGKVGYAR